MAGRKQGRVQGNVCMVTGAAMGLGESAARLLAREGGRVNSIHPGYIHTPLVESAVATGGDVQAGLAALAALHPVGHIGEPDDIGYGVVYLASDESKFVTGSALVIDGGYTAQ